jgi:uncharacterized membrane protein (UPF0127 family)
MPLYWLIMMVLKHNGSTIANQVVFARNIFTQALGLMFRKSIPHNFAMMFIFKKPRTLGVHMLFMRFPIDAVFLDQNKKVIATASLKPWWGHKEIKNAKYLIEMKQGMVEKYSIDIGDIMSFDE